MINILTLLLIVCLNTFPGVKSETVKITKVVEVSAYNSMESQCDSTPWITADGTRCKEGVIATNALPFGTKVWIEGQGHKPFVVHDRMNRRYKDNVDIWFRDYKTAIKFGRKRLKITYFIKEDRLWTLE